MKSFFLKILAVTGIVAAILMILVCIRYFTMQSLSWKIPQQKHILFMGASHISRGINDGELESAINFSSPSERYMFTYIKLKRLLAENHQIDTCFIECAPTDLWEHTDDKYFNKNEQAYFIPLYWAFFSEENWKIYEACKSQIFGTIVSTIYKPQYFQKKHIWHDLGSYIGDANNNQKMDRRKVTEAKITQGEYGHDINFSYLRKIVELCKRHDVKLYLLYCPVYHPEYYYDQDAYYQSYKEYFPDVELLDYSHCPMADDERYDAHHLNSKGAEKFTKILQTRFGFK